MYIFRYDIYICMWFPQNCKILDWNGNLVAVLPLPMHVQLDCYMLPTMWHSLKHLQYFIQMHRQIVINSVFLLCSAGTEPLWVCCCYSGKALWREYVLPTALCCCCSQSCSSEQLQSISILCLSQPVFATETPLGCCGVWERVDTENTSANHTDQKCKMLHVIFFFFLQEEVKN